MSAMAEVIDESIRNMTANMVTKADQEKVVVPLPVVVPVADKTSATLHPTGGLRTDQIRASAHGEE